MDCPGCKQPTTADSVFCPHCGLGLAGTSACPDCGAALAPWEHPCPSCGTAEKPQRERRRTLDPAESFHTQSAQASDIPPDGDGLSDYENLVSQGLSADRRLFAGIGVAIVACATAFYLLRAPAPVPARVALESATVVKSPQVELQPPPSQQIAPQPTDAQQVASLRPAEPSRSEGSSSTLRFQPPPASDDAVLRVDRDVAQMAAETKHPVCEAGRAQTASSRPPVRKPVQTAKKCPPSAPKRVAAAPPRRATGAPTEAPTEASTLPPTVTAPVAAAGHEATGWHVALKSRIAVCERQPFVERTVCREKARWKYCSPSRWNKVPECALITHASNH